MIYCINCGAKNDNFVKVCIKCKHSFASRSEHFRKIKPKIAPKPIYKTEWNDYTEDEVDEPSYNPDIMPEPFTPEEIESIQVASANNSVKLSFPKEVEKKASRKRKKN